MALACVGLGAALALGSPWWGAPPPDKAAQPRPAAGSPARTGTVAPPPVPAATDGGTVAGAHTLAPEQIDEIVRVLTERLAHDPGDADGWATLARTHAVLGRHARAVDAFRKAAALRPDDAVLLADFADALAMTRGGQLEGEPLALVRRALKVAPDNLKALSLAGTAAFDQGDFGAAVRHWERLQLRGGEDHALVRQVAGGLQEARRRATGRPG